MMTQLNTLETVRSATASLQCQRAKRGYSFNKMFMDWQTALEMPDELHSLTTTLT